MKLKLSLPAVVAVVVYMLFDTPKAYGWGPATHAQLASDVLGQLSLLPATLGGILARYGSSYVFGNLAADVVFAKRMSKIKQFCHHWSTGFNLLETARHDRDRAFAYGYLSHLAADTVAHGKYVPRQLSATRTTLNFGHLYWEMRADALVDRVHWRTCENAIGAHREHHHQVLAEALTATWLPYEINRRLFERINGLVVRDYWGKYTAMWYRCSRWDLCAGLVSRYHQESVGRIMSVLTHLERSSVLTEDPNGTAALHQARLHRRSIRRLRRRGIPTAKRMSETVAALAPMPTHD